MWSAAHLSSQPSTTLSVARKEVGPGFTPDIPSACFCTGRLIKCPFSIEWVIYMANILLVFWKTIPEKYVPRTATKKSEMRTLIIICFVKACAGRASGRNPKIFENFGSLPCAGPFTFALLLKCMMKSLNSWEYNHGRNLQIFKNFRPSSQTNSHKSCVFGFFVWSEILGESHGFFAIEYSWIRGFELQDFEVSNKNSWSPRFRYMEASSCGGFRFRGLEIRISWGHKVLRPRAWGLEAERESRSPTIRFWDLKYSMSLGFEISKKVQLRSNLEVLEEIYWFG